MNMEFSWSLQEQYSTVYTVVHREEYEYTYEVYVPTLYVNINIQYHFIEFIKL